MFMVSFIMWNSIHLYTSICRLALVLRALWLCLCQPTLETIHFLLVDLLFVHHRYVIFVLLHHLYQDVVSVGDDLIQVAYLRPYVYDHHAILFVWHVGPTGGRGHGWTRRRFWNAKRTKYDYWRTGQCKTYQLVRECTESRRCSNAYRFNKFKNDNHDTTFGCFHLRDGKKIEFI